MDADQSQRAAGLFVEGLALTYLKHQGFKLLTRNFYSRYGEIDLIMTHKSYIVFIEVRHRLSEKFGGALESITWHKQQKLLKTAEYFLSKHQAHQHPCRFDVLCYSGPLKKLDNRSEPLWIINAF